MKKLTITLTIVIILYLPCLIAGVEASRGYFAVGGEWLLPFFPGLIYSLVDTIKQTFINKEDILNDE